MNEPTQQAPSTPAAPSKADSLRSQLSNVTLTQTGPQIGSQSTEKMVADRGTQPASQSNQTNNTSSGVEKTDGDKVSASNSQAEPTKEVKQIKNRRDERIKELLEKVNKLEEAQAPKAEAPKPLEKQEIPKLVPPPVNKSQYDRKQLIDLKFQAIQGNDVGLLRAVEDELAKHQEFDLAQVKWEFENGKAWDNNNNTLNHYRNQMREKWADLFDPESPRHKEYQNVHSRFTEIQKNPALLEWELASIADLRIRANESDALKTQLKQAEEKLSNYEKKLAPSKQIESATKGEASGEKRTDAIRSQLKDLGKQLAFNR